VNKYNEEVARRIIGEFRGTFDGTTLTFYYPPGISSKGIYKQLKLVAPNHLRGRLCGGDEPDIPIEWTR
jgi:hypothetical protein